MTMYEHGLQPAGEIDLGVGDQCRQFQGHGMHHWRPVMNGHLTPWRSCSTLASASIGLANCVARSTVSSISASAMDPSTSPRRADCTCAFSTAKGAQLM